MSVRRDELVRYANELLEAARWPEFAPPGLQVIGAATVNSIVCGVSSSVQLFEAAAARRAELVLVHHGMFWRNEPLVVDLRLRRRLELLFRHDISLLAYHLALDAHPELGNSAQLAARLGATPTDSFGSFGLACNVRSQSIDELTTAVAAVTGREPLVLPHGPERIERIAISSGAAGYDLVQAAHEGFAALLTGEPEEPNLHAALELGIHLIAAGHHATERYGVQALAAHLAERFELTWEYVEVENPV